MYLHTNVIVLLSLFQIVFCGRILGIYPVPCYSHHRLGDVLFKELAKRGHDVTVISPYEEKEKTENFRTITLTGAVEIFNDIRANLIKRTTKNFISIIWNQISWTSYIEFTLNHTNVQKLLKSNETFDLVIVEHLYNNAHEAFCYHYNTPCIITSSIAVTRFINRKTGNPSPPSFIPEPNQQFPFKMNFFQRCLNFIVYIISEATHHLIVMPTHDQLMHKYFPTAPSLTDLYYNISLVLINSYPTTNPSTPLLPNMIQIGGYHIKNPKPLSAELQKYLDNSYNGVILFSLGSNILATDVSPIKLNQIIKSFSRVKQNVLWKWDNESLSNVPSNVRILKWYPQNDVLAHPNVKLFITHCGLLSNLEALYHAVPTINVPIFGDQFLNAINAERSGYAITIPYSELNDKNLPEAVYEIFNNSMYLLNAKKMSNLMRDRPMKPLDTAVYWIEYVLRHKDVSFLQSPALNLTWYQYMLFDVAAFLGLIVMSFVLLIYVTCKKLIFRRFRDIKKNKKD